MHPLRRRIRAQTAANAARRHAVPGNLPATHRGSVSSAPSSSPRRCDRSRLVPYLIAQGTSAPLSVRARGPWRHILRCALRTSAIPDTSPARERGGGFQHLFGRTPESSARDAVAPHRYAPFRDARRPARGGAEEWLLIAPEFSAFAGVYARLVAAKQLKNASRN